ncbi:MAG: Bug family tripartite tricarboxylate transporter substrate binding protein [Xanthobacteraceae bacterium]
MHAGTLFITVLCAALASASLRAQPAGKDYYKGKQIRMIVGHGVGADYDIGGRLLAKHLARHIPGQPTIIVQNMPGAGSTIAANYLFSQAPKDGTVFGSFSRNLPSQALLGNTRIKSDPRKFSYLGATSLPSRVCVFWNSAKARSFDDAFSKQLVIGAAAGGAGSIVPVVLNHVLKTKFRVIEGYKTPADVIIAMERGEVDGICTAYSQFRNYGHLLGAGKMRIVMRAEERPSVELSNVRSIYSYAKTDRQRRFLRFVFSTTEFGRPYVMPPGVPPDVVAVMRKAMADTVKDPALIAEAKRSKVDMHYTPPEQLEQLVASLYDTPPDMIDAVRKLVPHR